VIPARSAAAIADSDFNSPGRGARLPLKKKKKYI